MSGEKVDAPREMTEEECRNALIDHIHAIIADTLQSTRLPTQRDKLELVAFSILTALDGCAGALPGFKVIPHPHRDDKKFHATNGENWWPNRIDIAGSLHDHFFERKPK